MASQAASRARFWERERIVKDAVVFPGLAAFIAVVYVGVVVGVGRLVGVQSAASRLALSIAATAIVAMAFEPIRARLKRVANRLLYGDRATPYEVLSNFTQHVACAYSGDDVLARMAQVLADATDAGRADVWLAVDSQLVPTATWPKVAAPQVQPVQLQNGRLPQLGGVDRAVPVAHKGELLGALSVTKRAGEAVSPVEDKLLSDLASQAGLVLRNVRLTTELRARLNEISAKAKELQASRQRIVAAQDKERRRLERNIHDGAQQHLVALAVKLRLAKTLARRDPQRARDVIAQLRTQTDDALETLRDLARGIYPPLLTERGLSAALSARVAKSSVPVRIHSDGISRYPIESEAAVYFCCLEALQNVAKYANASSVDVRLLVHEGRLSFEVSDDGIGFDAKTVQYGSGLGNMRDRLEAAGGRLEVRSTPGSGTTVAGYVPVKGAEGVS
jgi:signal transduction histidine kinase